VRYQFIEEHRGEYPVSLLCETLEVSVSGYYDWRKRPMSQHAQADAKLAEQLQAAYHAHRRLYGSPRLYVELHEQGISCSRKRVARLMRAMELAARRPRHRTRTTRSDPEARVAPNLLNQEFTASQPNEKWTGDITAVWTYEGWLYLAVVLDLFSRQVVGWAMEASQGERLVEMAFRMAWLSRRPGAGLLFHSDRGSQYTSDAYRALLAEAQVTVSMSRTGNCYDNAVTESFFGTLKTECVDSSSFESRTQARQAIFEYTECFYNRVRRHSSLGYKSPVIYEQLMC
jgi:putative transposase